MLYSLDNLRAQLAVATNELEKAKKDFKTVSSPDWSIAKEYGEQTRVNWLRTINQRIAHWTRRVSDIEFSIIDKE